jgi:uncharacterized delta-60 repeat protein
MPTTVSLRRTMSLSASLPALVLLASQVATTSKLQAQSGTLDTNFSPVITSSFFANINAMVVQTNDQVIFGGTFANVSGLSRNGIARLNANGSVDTNFNPGKGISGGFGSVNAIALQPNDGKILIGGSFTSVNGTNRASIARLNTDGSLDLSFNPGTGADNTVLAIALQPDRSILLAGIFTTVNGKSRGSIARLDETGALDTNFVNGAGANNEVDSVALQTNGQIIIGGRFTQFNGLGQNRIARLQGTNGAVDASFNVSSNASDFVNTVFVQPDGKVLVGGGFTNINSVNVFGIARLQANGLVDPGFTTSLDFVAFGSVFSVARQSNGKVFIGGNFSSVGGVSRPSFARLNADGTLDTGFVPDAPNSAVVAIGLQSSGDVIVAGGMAVTDSHGNAQFGVARLHGDSVSPPAHPLLTNMLPLSGAFGFTLNGEAGRTYIIQFTADFTLWTPWMTQMLTTTSQSFTDSVVAGVSRRLYRAQVSQ